MEDKVKKYLEDLEVPYNAEHWNLMEQRMAIEELSDFTNKEDEAFDEYVRKEVQFQEPVYNHHHWELMAEKLEERTWRGFIYKYKLAEVGLMLLLLWTVWFTILPQKEETNYAVNNITSPSQPKGKPVLNHKSFKTSSKLDNTSFATSKVVDEVAEINTLKPEIKYNNQISLNGIGSFNTVFKLAQPSVLNKNIMAGIFQSANYNAYTNKENLSKAGNYAKSSPDIRIGVFAASGIESISSEDKLKESEESKLAYGYGGGISLGLKFKDIELETGASYNALIPLEISQEVTTNNTASRQSNVDAIPEEAVANKFLKLPFALKYLFDNEGSWKFYALGGGNVHIDVNNRDFQQRSSTFAFDAKAAARNTSLSSNQLNQGATFFDRFYYSASIGFGVERQLSEKLSVFVQPEYYHQLYKSTLALGTGQTNTFTLSVGMKSTL